MVLISNRTKNEGICTGLSGPCFKWFDPAEEINGTWMAVVTYVTYCCACTQVPRTLQDIPEIVHIQASVVVSYLWSIDLLYALLERAVSSGFR
jgi:hypothetical protein